MLLSASVYHVQRKPNMFSKMRKFVILNNLIFIAWFISLQVDRFKDTGRACSGEFLKVVPGNYGSVYLPEQGTWLKIYIISQYVLYIVQKIISIVITNKLEAQYDQERNLILNKI